MTMWTSLDEGKPWKKTVNLTRGSPRNHAYARRPVHAHPDFYAFWADGDADRLSESHLYFCNQSGDGVWRLPYDMTEVEAIPERIAPGVIDGDAQNRL
jgi:hypothetical protein